MKYKAILATLALLGGMTIQAEAQDVVVDSLGFDKAMAVTPATLVQGQVAGVRISPIDGNVNGAVNTLIRGVNALRSDSQPLWIVDGAIINSNLNMNKDAFFQYGEQSFTSPLNALASLNAYDIESIEVLKDLSATAIYGSKGANGVIIIKTKLSSEEGTRVNWTSNLGLSTPSLALDGTSNTLSHNHYLNVSGASGQTRYVVSGYFRQLNGIIDGNDAMMGGLRATFDTKANSAVWFGMNTSITMGNTNSVAGTSYFGKPSLTMTMRDPNFFPSDTFEGWKADYDDGAQDRRLTSSMYLTLNFTPALSLRTSMGLDFENNNRFIWYGDGTSFGLAKNGAASVLGTSLFKYNAASLLTWNRFFGSDHNIVLKAQVDASGNWDKLNTINGTDFFSHALRAKGINIAGSKATLHKFDHNYNTYGGYAGFSYTYKKVLGINGTLRADCTPRYDDSNYNLYKAGDVWFDVRNAFLSDNKTVSTLKVKAGYGEAGREQYVPYGLYDEYISGTYETIDEKLQMFYEGLNRVRSIEFNAGIDLGLASDRVKLYAGYYDKMTNDVFNAYCFGELSPSSKRYWHYCDRSDVFKQSSLIANRGFEGSVNLQVLKGRDFGWTVYANAAYNVNQMLRVDSADDKGRAIGEGVLVNANVVGYPVGTLYGFKVDSETGEYIDTTNDGKYDEFDKDVIGNPNPKIFGGAGTTFTFKGLTLDVLANGAFGFDILNLNSLLFNETAPYHISETYIEKGDYVKLSRVSLGYTFPMKKVKWIRSLNVNVSALNLMTFTQYSGWDPEVNCFGTTYLSSGVDYGSYPTARSIVAGISLNF